MPSSTEFLVNSWIQLRGLGDPGEDEEMGGLYWLPAVLSWALTRERGGYGYRGSDWGRLFGNIKLPVSRIGRCWVVSLGLM